MVESCNERSWRTRKDPFEAVWGESVEMLEIMPDLEAVTLFRFFQEKYPDGFEEGQLRTLQRRVTDWKAMNGPAKEVFFDQKQVPGKVMEIDWMHDKLSVTVGGRAFEHLLCHCVLPYSNWEYAGVCFSESLLSLRVALQSALVALGRRPEVLQVDNSSAATHRLGGGCDRRGFTERFESVLKHFGLKGRTIHVGKANENGAVECAHGHLRRRLDQALMLRGRRDFASQEEYEGFVREQVGRANGLRKGRVAQELAVMPALTAAALTDYDEASVRVGAGSTLCICKRVYSVPSRLIGCRLGCRIYVDRIDLYHGRTLVHSLERVYEKGDGIDWRDLVDSMVKKPGALGQYRYRDAFFPSAGFVRLCERLKADRGEWQGYVEYLQALSMCRGLDDAALDGVLASLLEDGEAVSLERVRLAAGLRPARIELEAFVPDLSGYDVVFEEVQCG